MSDRSADEVLARAHRALSGRLVGWLFRMTGDLQLAEDAVAHAFASAVRVWRERGAPESPEAWLRVAARNHARSALSRGARTVSVDVARLESIEAPAIEERGVDDRLAVLFVCAHPAIDERMHTPLMLQAALGVDAARIASIYLVPPATMGQRLSRAKTKIRDAGIRFRMPEPDELLDRVPPVLQAVYGAYAAGEPFAGASGERDALLRAEALRLSEVLTEHLPGHAEAWGLRALLLHTESRRGARVVDGEFVPLPEQDPARWSTSMRREADSCLRRAGRLGAPGRFQLEAAISATHSARGDGVFVEPREVATLYDALLRAAPSIGAVVGAAAVRVRAGDLDVADGLLGSLPPTAVRDHQPYWVCRWELDVARAELDSARSAADVAIGLTVDPLIREHLIARRAAIRR